MLIDVEWSKDHTSVIWPYTLILFEAYVGMVDLRPGRAHRGKRRTVGWEGLGE
jgi:hypothetical protein